MKPKVQFSIRLPDEVITSLDQMAEELGTLGATRNNVVEQACAWYVRVWKAHGNRPLTATDMRELEDYLRQKLVSPDNSGPREKQSKNAPETILMQDAPGTISELPVPGSSPAKTPARYQKGTGRKSSQ